MRLFFFPLAIVCSVASAPAAIAASNNSGQNGQSDHADILEETALDPADSAANTAAAARASIAYSPTLTEAGDEGLSAPDSQPQSVSLLRAGQPIPQDHSAISGISDVTLFNGGKLLLTNGITSLEGASGGGIATWATIAGRETEGQIGASAHFSAVELPDFGLRTYGIAVGIADRLELSYARQNFDTRSAGATLGLGEGYTFNQDIYGAKLRVAGDIVYGATLMPQIAVGVEYKRSLDAPIVALLGAGDDDGIDYTLSATKLLLEHSLLVSAAARLTKGNQMGLLGFGSAAGRGYRVQFEGSVAYQISRRAVIGAEYRSKPDNLGLGEDGWIDIFAAYALNENFTLSAAYVDLGSIATFEGQRGGFLQAQIAF